MSPSPNTNKMNVNGNSGFPHNISGPDILCTASSSQLKLMFSEQLVAPLCGAVIFIAILKPPHLRPAIFFNGSGLLLPYPSLVRGNGPSHFAAN